MVLIAVVFAFVLLDLVQPLAGEFSTMENALDILARPAAMAMLTGIVIVLVALAGAYPALFLSGFSPTSVLKGTFSGQLGGGNLRKILVTTQFALSGALIVCTLVIYQQLDYMKEKDLGFAGEQIVVIPIHRDNAIIPNFDRLKAAYRQNSNVKGVTASSHLLLATFTYTNTFRPLGTEQDYRWERYTVEADYPEVYDLKLIAGRSFRADVPSDTNAVILNRRAVGEMGLKPDEVLGRILQNRSMDFEGEIVGVMEDFHFQSLHESIQPFVLVNRPDIVDYISVKINPVNISSTIDFLEDTWNRVIPEASFGYYFLDDTFAALYKRETNLSNAVLGFSLVAILLACLGLFGLALFTAERRTKEIGVRKVLGATVWDIVRLIGKDFSILIGLALVVAFPVSYLVMRQWLSDYAYRIDMSWWFFVVGALVVIGLSWITVSWHTIRAATRNPVDSLRRE